MNFPEDSLEFILCLLLGCTVLLALGVLVIKTSSNPVTRQRAGEITVFATTIYFVLACIPLDLPSRDWIVPAFSKSKSNFKTRKQADTLQLQSQNDPLHDVELITDKQKTDFSSKPSPGHEVSKLGEGEKIEKTNHVRRQSTSTTGETIAEVTNRRETPVDLSRSHPEIVAESDDVASSPLRFWKRILPPVYILGVVYCSCWLLLGKICLFFFLKRSGQPTEEITESFNSICSRHLSYTPRLLVSRNRWRAFSCGYFHSTIVVPESLCSDTNRPFLRTVFLHEIAHVIRRDSLSRLLFNLAFPLLYIHPFYWWIKREVDFSSELIADDWAAKFSTPLEYAKELTAMKRLFSGTVPILFGSSNFFSSHHNFSRRITMLIRRKTPLQLKISTSRKLLIFGSFAIFLCGLVFTTGVRDLAAEETSTTAEENTFDAWNNNIPGESNHSLSNKNVAVSNQNKNNFQLLGSNNKSTNANAFKSKPSKTDSQKPKPLVQRASSGSSNGRKGRPVELIQLATQYADAIETIAEYSSQLDKMIATNKKRAGTISNLDIQRTETLLSAAKRKQKLFFTITKAELDLSSTELELAIEKNAFYEKLLNKKLVSKIQMLEQKRELVRLKGRLNILETILKLK